MVTANMRRVILLVCLGVAVAIALMVMRSSSAQLCRNDFCVDVEVVSRQEEMIRGLQGRTSLAFNKGMLFIFKTEGQHRFWMKDMLMPIDIIWLDRFGTVLAIEANVPPCTAESCPMYAPANPARYVLEVNSGFTQAHGLKAGDTFALKGIR